ncbi:MAG: hypothetical protein MUF87_04460 [Anaerolineae bacterium]|nr:hypothetical protein [Anaerolineae bacterium]
MRYLHPVTMREKFLASGIYQLTDPTYPAPIQEEWSIHQLPDRSWFIRIDSQSFQSGHSRIIEVLRSSPESGGQFERCDLAIYTGQRVIRERFVRFEDYLQWTHDSDYQEIPLDQGMAIQMPGWVNLTALVDQSNDHDTFMPLAPPFHPIVYQVRDLREQDEGTHYHLPPIAHAAYFNRDRVLWRLEQATLTVQLKQYARNVTDFKMI